MHATEKNTLQALVTS